jgi:hypothetical protein
MPSARRIVTATESVRISRSPEDVFDYTQDYSTRSDWDSAVTAVTPITETPRTVRLAVAGVGRFTVVYQLFRRPDRTSAAFVDVESRWITGGGGSWSYAPDRGGTLWTQTNSFELPVSAISRLLHPLIRWNLRRSMRRSMAKAKHRLEAQPAA